MANNKTLVPEAKAALEKFKMEAAGDVGVTLNQGYNGDLTSRQAGSIGGQMVNIMNPVRTMKFDRHNRISQGHKITVRYSFSLPYKTFRTSVHQYIISDCCRSINPLFVHILIMGENPAGEMKYFFDKGYCIFLRIMV